MGQLGCRCGERMTNTADPSPCTVYIYYKEEVDGALAHDPEILFFNFLTDWDEKNNCQAVFTNRPEPVDYWFCPVCKRLYEVQNIYRGRWLRIYKRTNDVVPDDFKAWRRIYVITDEDTFVATEENEDLHLADYVKRLQTVLYYLSPDEKTCVAYDGASNKILFTYVLEDSWSSSVPK